MIWEFTKVVVNLNYLNIQKKEIKICSTYIGYCIIKTGSYNLLIKDSKIQNQMF